jgi:hypothetical protein
MYEIIVQKFGIEVATGIGGAVAALVVYAVKKGWQMWTSKKERKIKEEKEMIPRLVKRDIGVYRDLTELLVQMKADRAFIMQFHNGMYYANKGSQMKMSCTHEIVREGISREQEDMQDMLLSKFPQVISDLLSNPFVCFLTKEKDHAYYFSQLLKSQGVEKVFLSLIRDGDVLEGFLCVSYLQDESHHEGMSEDEAGKLTQDYANKIGFTLRKKDE